MHHRQMLHCFSILKRYETMKYQTVNMSFISILLCVYPGFTLADYWSDRNKLIKHDKKYTVGSNLKLTDKEKKVSDILMSYKLEEYDAGFIKPSNFLASQHFFDVKDKIERSKVFDIIKQIPKGASLHSHDKAAVSQEYLYGLTYKKNLYICIQENKMMLHFFRENNIDNSCNWTLISDIRRSDPNFDSFLKSKLSIVHSDPDHYYPDINSVWKTFQDIFKSITGLFTFKPIFKQFFYETLKELYEDNVIYVEFRGYLPDIYDLDGHIYSDVEVAGMYVDTLRKFQKKHPKFVGAKLIYAPTRVNDNITMDRCVNTFELVKNTYPDFIAGFDLVGQEDLGKPLTSFLPQLLRLKKLGTEFFFHSGETNWEGESTDLNLIDAILLNTTRIGHGYAILKHPLVAKLVKKRKIAVEVCPISNQVLKLVRDLRNHPAAILIANGFPVVIAPDDPTFWGSKGLSYDWYMTFMGMTSRETDLRFLKQIAINSIEYSSLDENHKMLAMAKWENDWKYFIETILNNSYGS